MTDFIYTPATTRIDVRWRTLYNWVPPSEDPVYQKKWADFRALAARGIESLEQVKQVPQSKLLQWRQQ